ncbi:MAG: type II secretion system F family protein [Armatimonadota bacterium]
MPRFAYKAKDSDGNTVIGELEADSERDAAILIQKKGHWPIEIRRITGTVDLTSRRFWSRLGYYLIEPIWAGVNIAQLVLFYRQMATMLGSGMGIAEALNSIGRRTRGRLGRIIREAAVRAQSGCPLSETLARYPRIFTSFQLSLLKAGETGGLFERMVDRIATYLEWELTIRKRIAAATFYPKLLAVCILVIPLFPTLVLRGPAPFLLAVYSNICLIVLGLVGFIVAIKLVFQFESTRLVWDFIKLRFPVLGWSAHKTAMARFSRAMSALYAAGVSIAECVSISADASGNVYLARRLKGVIDRLHAGESLATSLSASRALSPIVLDMLATGDKTGAIDVVLDKIAEYMEEEVDATLQKVGPVLLVVGVSIAGFVVGMMVVNFYSGYFSNLLGGVGQ